MAWRSVTAAVMAAWLLWSSGIAWAQSANGAAGSGSTLVLGDVLNIEDGDYILKDLSGHEVRLRVDQSTQMKDRIKVGDKVEAQATGGHADSIRVKLPDEPIGPSVVAPMSQP